jgi:2-oxoglutarate ferredoxin oxidoreductase subunit beta
VTIGENGVTEADILVHNAEDQDNTLHLMLAKHQSPTVMGVIRRVPDLTLGDRIDAQMAEVKKKTKFKSVNDLLLSGDTWEVE